MIANLMCLRPAALLGLLSAAACADSSSQSFTKITTGSPVTETGAWRSVNWVDYDRDGDLDLFVTRGLTGGQDNVLFRNEGSPSFAFTRMSALPISQDHRPSDGATWADYDNDGYPDAFVANWYGINNLLYHNGGNGSFTQITTGPPVTDGGYSETASWGDYNNDGLVDLYVANSGGSRLNYLYRNAGNGQFTKITAGRQSTDVSTSRGVNWVDYDDDGDVDLFVANEANENELLYRNMLLESGIDTFQRVTTGPLVTSAGSSWSGSWADYDNDGDLDVFVANNSNQASRIFVNGGAGSFTQDTAAPVATDLGFAASAVWGDIDNDGDLDLAVTHAYSGGVTVNFLYKNMLAETDTARFERVLSGPLVTDPGYTYGASWGDYDGDGDLDLFVARTQGENQVNAFYRNDGNSNHWLTLDLRGTASNASAIGAKVRVRAVMDGTPVWQVRVVEGQGGYCGQNLQLHFGLRDAISADSLVIEWPSGNEEVFTGVAADAHLVVVELDSTPVTPLWPPQGFLNDSPDVLLMWNRSLHYPPYRLQVSTDSTFSGGMVADTLVRGDTAAVVRVVSNLVRYYWRVRPDRSIHEGIWSAVRSFDNDVQAPGAAPPLAPAEGAVDVPVNVQFRWGKAVRATGYHLRLSADSSFATLAADTVIPDTVFMAGSLPFLTKLYWDVRSENLAGSGPVPAVRSFTTVIEAPAMPVPATPPAGGTNVPVPSTLSWSAADRAAAYTVHVGTESQFFVRIVDTLVADTSIVVGGLWPYTEYYWRVRSVNAGGNSAFTAVSQFRTSVAAPQLLEPADDSYQFSDVRFAWAPSPPATGYHLQYGTDSTFTVVGHEDSTLTDTSFHAAGLQTETGYFWRVRGLHPSGAGQWSAAFSFFTSLDTFLYSAGSAWNLVSLPGNVLDRSAAAVFPGAITACFGYADGYAQAETLGYGRGYWVRLPAGSTVPIAGTKRLLDTIDVQEGWNLVGCLSEPLAVGAIGTVPGELTSSPVFGYDGSFRREDTLRPGRGYWIRVHQPGKLVLRASSLPAAAAGRLRIVNEGDLPPAEPGDALRPGLPLPLRAALSRNFPNPFNPSTEIRFEIPAGGDVRIEVFDLLGSRVAVLTDGYRKAGYHSVVWNASGRPGGAYFVRMISGAYSEVRSVLLMK